jgi:hypothetical protein
MCNVTGRHAAAASVWQLALTGVALTATVGSTAVLHYFTGPYVHALTEMPTDHSAAATSTSTTAAATDAASTVVVHPELTVDVVAQLQADTDATEAQNNRVFVAERMSILGRKKHTVFTLKDVVPQSDASRRPFVSFQTLDSDMAAQQQQRKTDKFYLHSHLFSDKPLLQKLLGRPLKDDEKATLAELQEKYLQQQQQQKQQTSA